jgi:hypothetical protein
MQEHRPLGARLRRIWFERCIVIIAIVAAAGAGSGALQVCVGTGVKAGVNVWRACRDINETHPAWAHLNGVAVREEDLPRPIGQGHAMAAGALLALPEQRCMRVAAVQGGGRRTLGTRCLGLGPRTCSSKSAACPAMHQPAPPPCANLPPLLHAPTLMQRRLSWTQH